MSQREFPSATDELIAWMEAVRPVPRILWTQETAALMDALASVDLGVPFETIAERVGHTSEALTAVLRKCPVELGPNTPPRPA